MMHNIAKDVQQCDPDHHHHDSVNPNGSIE